MEPGGRTPICLFGPYGPFVLACGFLRAGEAALGVAPHGADLPSLRYRLLLVESGTLRLDDAFPLAAGGALLLVPGARHRLRLGRRARIAHLLFDVVPSRRAGEGGALVSRDLRAQPGPAAVWGIELPTLVPAPLLPRLRERWARIRARYWGSLHGRLEANLLLGAILADLVAEAGVQASAPASVAPSRDGDPIARAVAYGLDAARLPGPVDCRDLAQASGLSPAQFRRRFARREGLGPRAWLRARRLDEAAALLDAGTLPAAAVGARFGWTSPAAFTRAFAGRFGCTPSAWRRR